LQSLYIFTILEDMRRRDYLGQMELMVLLAVIRPASDAYGVQICREISEKSGREVAVASVYAALERLEAKGLLISSLGDPTAAAAKRAHTLRQL
jgi:DNA-binding PadR family transcriptional regulator